MTGRGVDQILPHPGEPTLHEHSVRDARRYVELAEALNGPIPRQSASPGRGVTPYERVEEEAPDLWLVNLETSVTRNDDYDPGKDVHYRMNPDNMPCLTVARLDVCTLANNHVLDFGIRGLEERSTRWLPPPSRRRRWPGRPRGAAAGDRRRQPRQDHGFLGRHALQWRSGTVGGDQRAAWGELRRNGIRRCGTDLLEQVRHAKHRGTSSSCPIHWGSNWGYRVPAADVRLAHLLIDGGVDVLYGHSSHHPRPIEIYRGKLVLYGCGDLVDDYEGIAGYEEYRDDLRLLYLATIHVETGRLSALRMVPFQARQLRLHRASAEDSTLLAAVLDRISRSFGSGVDVAPGGTLVLKRMPGPRDQP